MFEFGAVLRSELGMQSTGPQKGLRTMTKVTVRRLIIGAVLGVAILLVVRKTVCEAAPAMRAR